MQHIAVICLWCQSLWRLAQGWFASLVANPGTRTEEPRWESKTGGDVGNRHGGVAFAGTPCTVALGAAPRTLETVVRYACWNPDTDPLGVFGKPGMGVLEPVSKGLRG